MARKENLVAKIEKAYLESRSEEQEELHNAIVAVMHEYNASIENTLVVLDVIRFTLMMAKYRAVIEGTVKLTDKPPLKKAEKK